MTSHVIAYNMAGAVAASGQSRAVLDRAIREGRLRAKKSGLDSEGNPAGVWIIPADALRDYIDGLADAS